MNVITSNQNPIVKEIKSLKEKKYREEKKLFFIEGIRFVEEAFKEDIRIHSLIISERLANSGTAGEITAKAERAGINVSILSDKLFKEISDTDNPQGIMAVIKMRTVTFEDIISKRGLTILLDSIQDPGNMGTIIRTADAAGAVGIITSKGCVDIYNPKVLRSTMGSVFHIPVLNSSNLSETIIKLKECGMKVFAAHLRGQTSYFEQDMKGSCAIVIGNEANGISDEVADLADVLVKIPMPGKAESLNASVAAGLLIYEAVRQKRGGH